MADSIFASEHYIRADKAASTKELLGRVGRFTEDLRRHLDNKGYLPVDLLELRIQGVLSELDRRIRFDGHLSRYAPDDSIGPAVEAVELEANQSVLAVPEKIEITVRVVTD